MLENANRGKRVTAADARRSGELRLEIDPDCARNVARFEVRLAGWSADSPAHIGDHWRSGRIEQLGELRGRDQHRFRVRHRLSQPRRVAAGRKGWHGPRLASPDDGDAYDTTPRTRRPGALPRRRIGNREGVTHHNLIAHEHHLPVDSARIVRRTLTTPAQRPNLKNLNPVASSTSRCEPAKSRV